jgi:heme/copper-type cytochrome/quinol oxidase subunit 3
MMLLILTEASLFGYLLFSYFYLTSMARGPWPPAGLPELRLALPNTGILLLSSGTMWWAESGIRLGRAGRLLGGLVLTLALGAVFLGIQVVEYRHQTFGPSTDAYGSLFFTITGFHGAHVAVGLLMIAVVALRAGLGHFSASRHLAVTNVAWYWHFVDAVWLAVFTSLYLSPRLVGT